MTAAEIAAMLVLVDAAISDLLTGQAQSVSIAGRSVTKSDLLSLNRFRKELEQEAAGIASEGRPAVVAFRNPMGGAASAWDVLP